MTVQQSYITGKSFFIKKGELYLYNGQAGNYFYDFGIIPLGATCEDIIETTRLIYALYERAQGESENHQLWKALQTYFNQNEDTYWTYIGLLDFDDFDTNHLVGTYRLEPKSKYIIIENENLQFHLPPPYDGVYNYDSGEPFEIHESTEGIPVSVGRYSLDGVYFFMSEQQVKDSWKTLNNIVHQLITLATANGVEVANCHDLRRLYNTCQY